MICDFFEYYWVFKGCFDQRYCNFDERGSWFQFSKLGLVLDMALKFYSSVPPIKNRVNELTLRIHKVMWLLCWTLSITNLSNACFVALSEWKTECTVSYAKVIYGKVHKNMGNVRWELFSFRAKFLPEGRKTNWFGLDKITFGFLGEDFLWSYFVKEKLQKKKKPAYLLWQMFIICIENANAAFMKLKTRGLNKDLFFLKLSGLRIVASNKCEFKQINQLLFSQKSSENRKFSENFGGSRN